MFLVELSNITVAEIERRRTCYSLSHRCAPGLTHLLECATPAWSEKSQRSFDSQLLFVRFVGVPVFGNGQNATLPMLALLFLRAEFDMVNRFSLFF